MRPRATGRPTIEPIELLAQGVAGYERHLTPAGELVDPHLGVPTQYGTPYHALCQAVLAVHGRPPAEADHARRLELARAGLDRSLAHVEDPAADPFVSHVDRATGSTWGINHRDFFWPAIMATHRLLREADPAAAEPFAERIAAVGVPEPFRGRPPHNWAMVWLAGEWQRMRDGLSDTTPERFDAWLGEFFATHIIVDEGLYLEPGLPNSYDLFTRVHLAEILTDGYAGAWETPARRLMQTGLDRSLGVQLSDGSLASAHRSTGQTWTDGAQVLFFTIAAEHFASSNPARSAAAEAAARRAFASLARWMRPDGLFSPVHNLLPPAWRVGYERYTADGHYATLALAFLAQAIARGSGGGAGTPAERATQEGAPRARVFAEAAPTRRALVHAGRYSAHVNGAPEDAYDALGLVDMTFGEGRLLHLAGSVRHLESSSLFNVGIAVRGEPGRSRCRVVAQQAVGPRGATVDALENGSGVRLVCDLAAEPTRLRSRLKRAVTGGGPPQSGEMTYDLEVTAHGDSGITVTERIRGLIGPKTLFVPYLRDAGTGETTAVTVERAATTTTVVLALGGEALRLELDGAVEAVLDTPHGYESRRGLCGLLRLDLAGPTEGIRYRISVER